MNLMRVFCLGAVVAVVGCGDDGSSPGEGGSAPATGTTSSGEGGSGAAGGADGTGGAGAAGGGETGGAGGAGGGETGGAGGAGGGETGGAGGAGGGPTQAGAQAKAAFCGAVVAPFCEAVFSCCTNPALLEDHGGTLEGCKTAYASACDALVQNAAVAAVDAGESVLDPGRLDACVAKLNNLAKGGASCTEPPIFALVGGCMGAFQGQRAAGESCVAQGAFGHVSCEDGRCASGTCVAYAAEGEACTVDELGGGCNRPDGQTCKAAGDTCGPVGAIGDACTPSDFSDLHYECASLTCGGDGKCAAPSPDLLCSAG